MYSGMRGVRSPSSDTSVENAVEERIEEIMRRIEQQDAKVEVNRALG